MEHRLKGHLSSLDSDTKFSRAIKKYGIENFTSEVIVDNVPAYLINAFEKYWINYYDSFQNGYNSTEGGDGISKPSKEIIEKAKNSKLKWCDNRKAEYSQKISESVKKLWLNEEYRNHQISKKIGRPNTEEQKSKISKKLKGRKKPEGFRVGCKQSEATKAKLSELKKGFLNPSCKPITIYKDDDSPFVTILCNFLDVCRELKLPTSIHETFKNSSKLYDYDMRACVISKLKNENKYQYKGWYARLAEK